MGKPSRRPNREGIKKQFKESKRQFKKLREQQEDEGMEPLRVSSLPNRKSPFKTGAEERMARNMAVTDSMRIMLAKLPVLLRRLRNIPDPRNPKKLKHKLTILIIYGILTFVLPLHRPRAVL